MLSGSRIDLRDNKELIEKLKMKKQTMIGFNEGCEMAKKIAAFSYVENSSLKNIVN